MYSVQAICRVLKISPSGYYEWLLDSSQPVHAVGSTPRAPNRTPVSIDVRDSSAWLGDKTLFPIHSVAVVLAGGAGPPLR